MVASTHACTEQRHQPETWTVVVKDCECKLIGPLIESGLVYAADNVL